MYLFVSCENPVIKNCSSQTYSDSCVKRAATLIILQEVACVIKCNNDLRTKKKAGLCIVMFDVESMPTVISIGL